MSHPVDDGGVPELIIGDTVSIGIFTYEDGMVKKIADLYEPEDWGGINGVHYRENTIILVNNGSDGSCYVCLSYHDGEYVTGVFDEYNPDTATVNGKEVTDLFFFIIAPQIFALMYTRCITTLLRQNPSLQSGYIHLLAGLHLLQEL